MNRQQRHFALILIISLRLFLLFLLSASESGFRKKQIATLTRSWHMASYSIVWHDLIQSLAALRWALTINLSLLSFGHIYICFHFESRNPQPITTHKPDRKWNFWMEMLICNWSRYSLAIVRYRPFVRLRSSLFIDVDVRSVWCLHIHNSCGATSWYEGEQRIHIGWMWDWIEQNKEEAPQHSHTIVIAFISKVERDNMENKWAKKIIKSQRSE